MADAIGTGYVIFRVGQEEYALPVSSVNSIIRYEVATPVPRAPESVLGVINLRGRVVPVVDLLRRFKGTAFEPGPASRIVVAEGSAGLVGLSVDAANEVTAFADEMLAPVPEGVLSSETARAFKAVVERGGSLIILLDLDEAVPRSEYASAVATGSLQAGDSDV